MVFIGIDLSAQAKHTGMAVLHDNDGGLVVEHAAVGVTDARIVEALADATRVGVDVPLGWPIPFVHLLADHAAQRLQPPASTGSDWRRSLALRATDRVVHQRTGLTPLSVSANLIAYPAFRWAGIEAVLRDQGYNVARDGSGLVAEVYPAAALYRWGLPHRGYKGTKNAAQRQQIVQALSQLFPTLQWQGFDALAATNDDVLDAVLAALIAHQIAAGNCEGPDAHQQAAAVVEGWIWLPKGQA